jgi:two-component system, OmpR family, phosphate regulon sensor histidine kinase PhoR
MAGAQGLDGDSLAAATLGALVDPLILTDSKGTVLFFNKAAAAAWPALEAGWPLSFTLRSPDVVSAVERVLSGERLVEGEYAERVPVERVYDMRVTAIDLGQPRASRNCPAAMLVLHDVTTARRLDMMRADFVANASHELRTPLSSLLGFIETLQGPARDDPAARERFLAIMRTQAQRMSRLIGDLLSLSRIEMSEHRAPSSGVDLVAVARQIVDTARSLAEERGVEVRLDAPNAPLLVAGDRDELLRVAENLVENAIRYGQSGKRVDVSVERVEEGGGASARLTVRDYGPGIAAEHLPRLTERFYRVDAADSRDKGGTGLGLAIVKHIVNRHRGRLSIESRPKEGAAFRVTIPLNAGQNGASN